MKTRWISLSVTVIALIAGSFDLTVGQQPQERVIKRMPVEKNEPLEIVDTKVNRESITLGLKFMANDEWLKTLVFTVRNTSNKRILFASIELFFPRAEGSKPMFDVFYGNWQLRSRPPQQGEHLVGIAAGDTVDIGFSDQRFAGLQDFSQTATLVRTYRRLMCGSAVSSLRMTRCGAAVNISEEIPAIQGVGIIRTRNCCSRNGLCFSHFPRRKDLPNEDSR